MSQVAAPVPDGSVAHPKGVIEGVKTLLHNFEFSAAGDGGSSRCPVCKQSPALDPANPRDFEDHTADCDLGNAIAALAAQ